MFLFQQKPLDALFQAKPVFSIMLWEIVTLSPFVFLPHDPVKSEVSRNQWYLVCSPMTSAALREGNEADKQQMN